MITHALKSRGQRSAPKARFEKWERLLEPTNHMLSVPRPTAASGRRLTSKDDLSLACSWDITDYGELRRWARVRRLLTLAQGCQVRSMSHGMEED
jgi:hypothetical protein